MEYCGLLKLTRFGDVNQIERTIRFFAGPNFTGSSFFVEPPGKNFTQPSIIRSYYFSGLNIWELKADKTDVWGTCRFYSDIVGSNGYGFTYQTNTAIQIGAVLPGCDWLITTPRGSTTIHSTTPNSCENMKCIIFFIAGSIFLSIFM